MFKAWRASKDILNLGRLPLRVQAQGTHQSINIQKVRFTQPFRNRLRRVAISCAATYLLFEVYSSVVLSPLNGLEVEEETSNETEEEEPTLFIPFPGTTKKVKPPPYRGSDPEWQEFIKFSKDPSNGEHVRNDLASLIRDLCEKSPALTLRYGREMQIRRHWLDIHFPSHPPPEFERSGIEIGDDFIAWSTMPVDTMTVARTNRALFPSAITISAWTFAKNLLGLDPHGTGNTPKLTFPEPVDKVTPAGIEDLIGRRIDKRPKPQQRGSSAGSTTKSQDTKTATPQSRFDAWRQKILQGQEQAVKDGENRENRVKSEPESPIYSQVVGDLQSRILNSYKAFRMKLAQTWKPPTSFPPRGCILVSGLVEIDAPRAWLTLDVNAAWDPKTRAYDDQSLHIALRRAQLKKQSPLGG